MMGLRGMKRAMVVEDDPLLRLLIIDYLMELGIEAVEYADGASASRALESGVDADVLITDVSLPKMDGSTLADAARRLRPQLPIMFTTGHTDFQWNNPSASYRSAIVGKPFGLDEFERSLGRLAAQEP